MKKWGKTASVQEMPHNKAFATAMALLIMTTLAAVTGHAGIKLGNNSLKYSSGAIQVMVLLITATILIKNSSSVNWVKSTIVITTISLYPLFEIIMGMSEDFQFKYLIDHVVIDGGYYQLIFSGLALAVLSQKIDCVKLLTGYALFFLPLGCLSIPYALSLGGFPSIEWGHILINNFFIPSALLVIVPRKKLINALGWIAVIAIFFLSAKIWSRSYTLVACYFSLFGFLVMSTNGEKKYAITIFCSLAVLYYLGSQSLFEEKSVVQNSSISEKFQVSTLINSWDEFTATGDFKSLFYWQGNSRADILVDAFSDFEFIDWMFGRGIIATYRSFVERSIIEIGWAQEVFRWGLIYVLSLMTISLLCAKRLFKRYLSGKADLAAMLSALILIRTMDWFVFGLTQWSLYNLIFFWGIMQTNVYYRKNKANMTYEIHNTPSLSKK